MASARRAARAGCTAILSPVSAGSKRRARRSRARFLGARALRRRPRERGAEGAGVLRRGRGRPRSAGAVHPRVRRFRALAGAAGAGGRRRARHGLRALRPRGRRAARGRPDRAPPSRWCGERLALEGLEADVQRGRRRAAAVRRRARSTSSTRGASCTTRPTGRRDRGGAPAGAPGRRGAGDALRASLLGRLGLWARYGLLRGRPGARWPGSSPTTWRARHAGVHGRELHDLFSALPRRWLSSTCDPLRPPRRGRAGLRPRRPLRLVRRDPRARVGVSGRGGRRGPARPRAALRCARPRLPGLPATALAAAGDELRLTGERRLLAHRAANAAGSSARRHDARRRARRPAGRLRPPAGRRRGTRAA